MKLITTISDVFWVDYLLEAKQHDGVWHFYQTDWRPGVPRHDQRIRLFGWLLRKMPPCHYLYSNLVKQQRELYVRD